MSQTLNALLDSALQVKDAGLIAATDVTQVGGADVTIDLGSANYSGVLKLVIDVSACEVADGNEVYSILMEGATTSAFSTAYTLGRKDLGDATPAGNAIDTAPSGRHELYFTNRAITSATDGSVWSYMRYLRCRVVVAGTVGTGINFTAFLVKA